MNIAFIGCGNLATSMVTGLLSTGYPKEQLWATSRRVERVNYFREHLGINADTDNLAVVANADIVVLAVKPQQMRALALSLAELIQQRKPLVISVAVGISTSMLAACLGPNIAIVRSMPNTPAVIKAGASGLFANKYVSVAHKASAEQLHRAIGIIVWVEQERQLDAVAALSGSGPAYFFYVIEAMQQAAIDQGLTEEQAKLLAIQTAVGASCLALESNQSMHELRRQVTSPNGTTEQAINVFEQAKLSNTFAAAMQAASDRALVLTQLYEENDSSK